MAGNRKKASVKFPFKIRSKARWVPHPRHSTPKSFLFRHGIMYFSMSNLRFICTQFYEKIFKGNYHFIVLKFVTLKFISYHKI